MQTIEITAEEATLIQQGLLALQKELSNNASLPLLTEDEWKQRFDAMCSLHLIKNLNTKVSIPFIVVQ